MNCRRRITAVSIFCEALEGYAKRIGDTPASWRIIRNAAAAWRISGAADRPLAILHHDLHASNLIDSGRGLMLIDWECAAVADPLLDIACILSYHEAARAYASLPAAANRAWRR